MLNWYSVLKLIFTFLSKKLTNQFHIRWPCCKAKAMDLLFCLLLKKKLIDWMILGFLQRCMKCRRGLAMRILSVCLSVRPSVCTSVRLSVTRVIPDKMEERSVHIFISYERTFSLVFWEEEWLVAGHPFYVKFWVNRPPLKRNGRFSTNNRS